MKQSKFWLKESDAAVTNEDARHYINMDHLFKVVVDLLSDNIAG